MDWSSKLDNALWSYQTTFKIPIGASPYKLVYGKVCHLSIKIEHKALQALNRLNLKWSDTTKMRREQMNQMDEFCVCAYQSSLFYKDKMKLYDDHKIEKKKFITSDIVPLFDSRLKLFPGNLKLKQKGPYRVVTVFPYDTIKLESKEGLKFKFNVQRVKHYLGESKESRFVCEVDFKEA